MQVRDNEQEMVTSNVYLNIKDLTNRKYEFNCHHKDGTVISTEAIVCKCAPVLDFGKSVLKQD